ncbi:3-hydroxyisobutyrate dehydrogenase [Granulosicoccus sp.]|nr:3-hydroxyisobutyrate dehydrogenase [Granulosicoccus sp.]MDB4224412.1 3-hydroxyisobutyrate dehydrogenase [Granulosicoccus sp.]
MTSNNITFIGLGNMGLPMATNLANAGHSIKGFDPQVKTDGQVLPDGLTLCSSLADAVSESNLIITMLPNGGVVLEILKTIIDTGAKPSVVLDCSTIDINDARKAHEVANTAGISFLDAPVSGGITGAAAGSLTTMIGGDETVLESIKPLIEPMFKTFIYCGAGGAGQAAKICNNMLLATSMIGTGETFNLGRKLGLDPQTLFNVLSTSTGSCWSVNSYCPVPGVGPTSPSDNDYQPGFAVTMMVKDMKLTQAAAESVSQATPMGAHALALYEDYANAGGNADDFSGIIRYLDTLNRD